MTAFQTMSDQPYLTRTKAQHPSGEKEGSTALRLQGRAEKAAFLINGNKYFAEVSRALRQARRAVWIVGWDFHPDIRMEPEKSDETLADLLHALAAANPELEIRILVWTLGPIYSDKSIDLLRKKNFPRNARIDLRFDLQSVLRGCHHQKLVCIDDTVAFIGGIDLTARRWDTKRHRAKDRLRRDPEGTPYDPLHDVQAMVTGDAARLIGDIARRRWEAATGEKHQPLSEDMPFAWPDDLAVAMRDIPVGFVLTEPATTWRTGICDGIASTLEIIARTRRQLYIEAQYLASFRVAEAIAKRLQEENGPEVIVICTRSSHGLIEKLVMGTNRDRVIRLLKRADRANRLRVYYAVVSGPAPGNEGEIEVLIHSKLIIADDELIRIGSSNLNNRSEGLDTECDLLLEAGDGEHRRAIADLRNRLLAEYLGTTTDTFAAAYGQSGSVIAAIDALNDAPGLREFPVDLSGRISPITGTAIFDPARPFLLLHRLGLGALLRRFVRTA
ncbi:phosphatidylserine/phosphatidylglycerophosphate/cardiolipin synthase-like enzyme [Rhizobium aethiopicum]|uniref:Phospholipase D n=1 Tax=Rhizobium aethiopicum TaxID=1138170 RepID=A0A7W6Q8D1_9HYPH|nr:phospholipase D-like domain-containing protein [Rhizobium aethiopicum]MBB4192423.1 phosphatidylserine/phosphatidylglycerophosphate/cardiolipin synthase-like enzyme [Rhizobium aethiopicum]MBB4579661.1 phosphatidylserine/phosphatidylglycerophosphate/cardiolipin synthase-like enzyme [Rhizobium aethiopicum]